MRVPGHLNFQAKVLLPVMSIMVLLVVIPTWLVSRQMARQLEQSASERLTTADAVFSNLRAMRAKDLRLRFANLASDPRMRAILLRYDRATTAGLLKDFLEEAGGDLVTFETGRAQTPSSASRNPRSNLDEFRSRSNEVVEQALHGQAGTAYGRTVSWNGRLYDVLSIPVSNGDDVFGALTFGIEMGNDVLQEFKQITRSHILLLADGQVAAATLATPDRVNELAPVLGTILPGQTSDSAKPAHPAMVLIGGEHYMSLAGALEAVPSSPKLQYVLLSSYEKPLRTFEATQRRFLWIQLGGIILGGALVWVLVRRATQPLRQLRDSAEAVGRGDFSQRLAIQSRDECGELAAVFNRMTGNLKASREELEKTVETLKSTQTQLIQSEKLRAIGTLAGGIAHDFNNILAAILGFGELVLDDLAPDSRTARNLKQVIKAGERAKDLVRQILAFSRQDQPQRTSIRLHTIVDETLKLLRATIPSTVEIRSSNRARNDVVIADASQLHQVLMNLGTNASHAMRISGGLLLVTLEDFVVGETGSADAAQLPPGAYVRLTVADTGHGMPPDVLQRVFEPFFTTKPVGEGTGLGLSVVHGIIKSHGGEISVTSKPGLGTTFFIFLPIALSEEAAAANSDQPLPGRSERLLVVDDEEPLVNLMHQKLSRLGYEVVAHSNSLAALKEFRTAPGRFDVVITDQTMPHLTGSDLAQEINRLRPETPVILCSGSGNALVETAGSCPAIRQCVSKPVNFIDLSRSLRQMLEPKN